MTTEISTGNVLIKSAIARMEDLADYVAMLETELIRLRELEESVINYFHQQEELKWANSAPKEIFDALLAIIDGDS